MKIIHIEDFFHPNAGYQVNILAKYQSKLGHQVYVITSKFKKLPTNLKEYFGINNIRKIDKIYYDKYNVGIIRVSLIAYLSGRSIYKKDIFKIVDDLKPDILYVHGNDTYIGIRYILKANKLSYPLISDNHMVEFASKNKYRKVFYWIYRKFITPKIIKNNIIIIRTANSNYIFKYYGIPKALSPLIGFGSDLMLFHPDRKLKDKNRKDLSIPTESIVIIYAGKLDEAKGGRFFAEAIKEKFETKKDIVFLIIGNLIGDYGKEISLIFEKSKNKIIHIPTQKYQDLAKYYQIADIAVFPKQCSLSFYDVQACGLPVLLEKNEINLKRIIHNNGMLFEPNNKDDFRAKIYEYVNMPSELLDAMKKNSYEYIKNNYNYEDICIKYMNVINESIERFNRKG